LQTSSFENIYFLISKIFFKKAFENKKATKVITDLKQPFL